MISNSSIQRWLDFNGSSPTTVQPCQIAPTGTTDDPDPTLGLQEISCAQVCTNESLLFQQGTYNLETCGLWAMIAAAPNAADKDALIDYNLSLSSFDAVGLNSSAVGSISNITEIVASCFAALYLARSSNTFAADGTVALACTEDNLFPLNNNPGHEVDPSVFQSWEETTLSGITACLERICSPRTLDPDIAGVGVYSALMIQVGIALSAFLVLFLLEKMVCIREDIRSRHKTATITALIGFHKNQCYFAGAVQIAIIAAFNKADSLDRTSFSLLSMNGLVPIICTLVCISRYGRQSWYMISLSLVMFLLSTTTLSMAYSREVGAVWDFYAMQEPNWFYETDACGNMDNDLTPALCGFSTYEHNFIKISQFDTVCVWAIWLNCLAWGAYCIAKKVYEAKSTNVKRKQFHNHFNLSNRFASWATGILLLATWTLCCGSQFYTFALYLGHSLIPTGWSFGQVIAVTIWLPSIVEFAYIEYSKSTYSAGILGRKGKLTGRQTGSKKDLCTSIRCLTKHPDLL